MARCFDCPVMCGADRQNGEYGVCGAGESAFIARAARHYYEEPPISGTRGSGAVFFTGCNMRCVFCQNREISRDGGESPFAFRADADKLADIMLRLQDLGAHNVNLVTPTPHLRLILDAIPKARARGLTVPIVYNTNGYELTDSLRLLRGLVDIYLPDLKYVTPRLSLEYSGRADYFEYASEALAEMQRQVGVLTTDCEGIAERGLIVRHLVLPCAVDETRRVLDHIRAALPPETYISLMSQYTPIPGMKRPLDRRITKAEYDRAVTYAADLGFVNVFIQKRSSAESAFTPAFDGTVE
ncbi:MAG: radical SAM protein [Clostridia bacterium]|nr:radical SAM protein [Clostridia bacterium]